MLLDINLQRNLPELILSMTTRLPVEACTMHKTTSLQHAITTEMTPEKKIKIYNHWKFPFNILWQLQLTEHGVHPTTQTLDYIVHQEWDLVNISHLCIYFVEITIHIETIWPESSVLLLWKYCFGHQLFNWKFKDNGQIWRRLILVHFGPLVSTGRCQINLLCGTPEISNSSDAHSSFIHNFAKHRQLRRISCINSTQRDNI